MRCMTARSVYWAAMATTHTRRAQYSQSTTRGQTHGPASADSGVEEFSSWFLNSWQPLFSCILQQEDLLPEQLWLQGAGCWSGWGWGWSGLDPRVPQPPPPGQRGRAGVRHLLGVSRRGRGLQPGPRSGIHLNSKRQHRNNFVKLRQGSGKDRRGP